MEYDKLTVLFENTPTFGLIKTRKAPLIISFLHAEFKAKNVFELSNTEATRRLADHLELLDDEPEETEEEKDFTIRARFYLNDWVNRGFLMSAPDDKTGAPFISLTPETEKVIGWLEEAFEAQRFIGTDSRFKDIFRKLREIIEKSTEDPADRIRKLEAEKTKIENEIRQILETGKAPLLEKHLIEENFIELSRMAKRLLADFKEVEKRFKAIGRQIYEKQSELIFQKGTILGLALDAWSELRTEDQGRSFYAFWQFLQSDVQKEELKELVDQLYVLLDQHGIPYGDEQFLRNLKRQLHRHGMRVQESNDKLAEKLNRVLAEKSLLERKRILELIQDIRQLAFRVIESPPQEDCFIELPVFEAEIRLPLNRRFVLGSEDAIIRRQAGDEAEDIEDIDFSAIYNQFYVDKEALIKNIRELLKERSSITLAELLMHYPIERGLTEIVTYYSIAAVHTRHQIDTAIEELLPLDSSRSRFIKGPQITFHK